MAFFEANEDLFIIRNYAARPFRSKSFLIGPDAPPAGIGPSCDERITIVTPQLRGYSANLSSEKIFIFENSSS